MNTKLISLFKKPYRKFIILTLNTSWILLFCFINISLAQELISESISESPQTDSYSESFQIKPIITYAGPKKANPVKRLSKVHDQNGRMNTCTPTNIVVTYNGFPQIAVDAFEYAVEIWESILVSEVPITISATWVSLDPDVLGDAKPVGAFFSSDNEFEDMYYPFALQNAIAGFDVSPSNFDIDINVNSAFTDWYFGTDGQNPANKYDFVTVILHEIAHGMGVYTDATASTIRVQPENFPPIFCKYLVTGSGIPITNYADNSQQLINALVSNDLYFNGPLTLANNNGNPVKINAPNPFSPGSSIAHLDGATYGSALMAPDIAAGDVIHSLLDIELTILYDMGWKPDTGIPVSVTACTDDTTPINLSDFLLCNEQLCGNWTINGNSSTGFFTPNGNTAGVYVFDYHLLPNGLNSSVIVELIDVNSGTANAPRQECISSTTAINLSGEISGQDGGGNWSVNLGGLQPTSGFNAANGTFIPDNNAIGQYLFDYTIQGTTIPGSPPLNCSSNDANTLGNFENGILYGIAWTKPANCNPDTRTINCNDFMLTINVSSYNGTANQMAIFVRDHATCSTQMIGTLRPGIGTYTFTDWYFPQSYNPTDGLCVLIYDFSANPTMTDIQFTAALDIDYPEIPASGCADETTTVTVDLIDCAPQCEDISGVVFEDADEDGCDSGGSGVAGIIVELFDCNSGAALAIALAVTAADGSYAFGPDEPGDAMVCLTAGGSYNVEISGLPAGYINTNGSGAGCPGDDDDSPLNDGVSFCVDPSDTAAGPGESGPADDNHVDFGIVNASITAVCEPQVLVQLDNTGIGTLLTSDVLIGDINDPNIQSLSLSKENFTCSEIGIYFVTLTLTDNNNVVSTCETVVFVGGAGTGDMDGDGLDDSCDLCPTQTGTSLHFYNPTDGSGAPASDHCEVPHDPDFNLADGDFAFEAWVYPDSDGYKTILSKGHGGNANTIYIYGILADAYGPAPGKQGLYLSGEWKFSNTSIPQHEWSHLAVSIDKNPAGFPIVTFYYNGAVDNTETYSISNLYNADTQPLYIGRQGDICNCNFFDGSIDDVAIWDRQLSQADVVSHMQIPYTGNEQGLVAAYLFDAPYACTSSPSLVIEELTSTHPGTLVDFTNSSAFNFCASSYVQGKNIGACPALCLDYSAATGTPLTGIQTADADYESDDPIDSDQMIGAPAMMVDYDSDVSVALHPGFEVSAGIVFHAFINGCTPDTPQDYLDAGYSVQFLLDEGYTVQDLIGLNHDGGIIFYINASNGSGLIAAPMNQSTAQWACLGTNVPAGNGTAVGTGAQNTMDIINAGCSSAGNAANLCTDLSLNGYNDWFLPSIDELTELYLNRAIVGGFSTELYWSSSEDDIGNEDEKAFAFSFASATSSSRRKNITISVRAIRAF